MKKQLFLIIAAFATSSAIAQAPVTSFTMPVSGCVGQAVQLTDLSSNTPTTWTWTASGGGNLSNANAQNPTITYTVSGTYTISLTASNGSGSGSVAGNTITVNSPTVSIGNNNPVCAGQIIDFFYAGSSVSSYTWSGPNSFTSSIASPTITAATPAASGSYSLSVTDANGCTNSGISGITVNPLPTVTVNSATICAGSTATLTASGTATSYTWNTSATTASITPSPTVATTYTVMGTDANNCINWATATINVNALPTLSVTATNYTICSGTRDTLNASGAVSYTWSPGVHTVTQYTIHPNVTTTYTLTGIDANGCTDTISQLIDVLAKPTITVASATICAGATATLTATGATTYTWNTSATTASIVVTPSVTTHYTVVATGTNSCTNKANPRVTVHALPTVSAVSDSSSICIGSSAQLTASGATTYMWSTTQTGASITVTPTITTTYSVVGTNTNNCSDTTTVTQMVSTTCVAGIEKYSSNSNQVTVYPNPNNGSFVITTSENTKTILVTDILGNELQSINPTGTITNVNIGAQPSGVYFIKVISGNARTVKRIIINN